MAGVITMMMTMPHQKRVENIACVSKHHHGEPGADQETEEKKQSLPMKMLIRGASVHMLACCRKKNYICFLAPSRSIVFGANLTV